MTLYDVYAQPLKRPYRAAYVSKATAFQAFSLLVTIVGPLLIAYRSQGFWLKTSHYLEQPEVHFKHEFFIVLRGKTPENYMVWSSYRALNQLEESHVRIPVIHSRENDFNRDGKSDQLELTAEFKLDAVDGPIHAVQFGLIFDYKLELQSRFQMECMAFFEKESLYGGDELSLAGQLRLNQKTPLFYRGIDQRFDRAIIDGSRRDASAFRLSTILGRYDRRNVSSRFEPSLNIWSPATSKTDHFRLRLTIDFVEESILYYSGFWELLKWGWVQYLSILIVFIFLMRRVRSFVFANRLVVTAVVQPPRAGE